MQRVSPESKATVKHSGRRKLSGNESGEKSSSAKRRRGSQTPPKRSGVAHDGGQQFEVKMAAVIGLRGMARGDNFQLSTNKPGSGNFDDLVYTTSTGRYFMQLKHTDNPDTTNLVHSDLVPLLHQCFESYCHIIQGSTFKDIPLNSLEFIIYTNKQLGPKLSQHSRQNRVIDVILKTSDKGEIFNFTPDKNKEIDVYTLVEDKVENTKEFEDLSPLQRDFKLDMISQFLKKLIMVTGQKGQRELDAVIIEEIGKHDKVNAGPEVYERDLLYFKKRIETWWRNKKEKMTSEMVGSRLQKAKTACCLPIVKSLFNMSSKMLVKTRIKFSYSEIWWLPDELSNKRAVHLRSDAITLSSILLLDCLPQSKCIFVNFECLQSNIDELLHAWVGGVWEWLIVSCDATVGERHISDTCLKISQIIKHAPLNKCVIILSSIQQVKDFVPLDHKFYFEQLSKESQKMVLDKKIDFQGCEVTMRSVLQQQGNVEHVLGTELVTDLITEGTAVNIGGKLHVNTGYYAHRVLERKVCLKSNVLRNTNDVFAVSGITVSDLRKFVHSAETIGYVSPMTDFTQEMSSRNFVMSNKNAENTFLEICKKRKEKSLHWLEYKNGHFWWKMSRGGTDSLLDYVDADKTGGDKIIIAEFVKSGSCEVNEELIWDLDERTVLVVAEPGMGKSSTTTQVAWHTKECDPTSWVVRINWNDHTKELDKINAATFNLDTLVEFLCSTAFPHSKYTDINRSLLKQALQSSGNVTVLMDGFDEISPYHADKAAVILSGLMKTEVRRLWVTSRPVVRERLEKQLSVITYDMKKLAYTSHEDMLFVLWKHKAGEEELTKSKLLEFIKFISWNLMKFVHDDNFTGCPLYITMIATAYEMEVKTCLNSEHWIEPRFDLVDLYEKFVERKLHIYHTEKQKADITNPSLLDDLEDSKQRLLKNFEKCALVVILPPPMLESLHNKQIEDEIKSFLERVEKGKDKTGIVMNVVEGKPQFVHRTFAEYFTARWFSENFQSNRSVLEHILFDNKYSFVKDMFDRMLAEDCPLHCAVLDWPSASGDRDVMRFETLLKEGCDANAVDKGSRTVMHIIAKHHSKRYRITELLYDSGVPMDNKDCVLQWTPSQYAVKAEKWYDVEWLLQRTVDRSGLDMIRQRADDTDYIHKIILEAAWYRLMLLLEFIRSIGVNIHQASDQRNISPLHAAICGRQLQVIRWLIKHGADCNTRYIDGQTALHYAVTNGRLDVVRVLVEEGGASVDVRDDCGRTVIDWVKDYMSDPKYREYYGWDYKRERLNEHVKYLQDRACKQTGSVWRNNEA